MTGARDSVENKISTTLIYINKSSCLDAAERVKVTSGVNVHQLTMRHEHLYHHLLLYLDRDGLRELWKVLSLAAPRDVATPTGLQSGLLGVMLESTVVWLKRAAALGKSTSPLPSPMETNQSERGELGVCWSVVFCVACLISVDLWFPRLPWGAVIAFSWRSVSFGSCQGQYILLIVLEASFLHSFLNLGRFGAAALSTSLPPTGRAASQLALAGVWADGGGGGRDGVSICGPAVLWV